MSNIKLKPCPFCGSAARMRGHIGYYVDCSNNEYFVSNTLVYFETEKEAAEAWNRRTGNEHDK